MSARFTRIAMLPLPAPLAGTSSALAREYPGIRRALGLEGAHRLRCGRLGACGERRAVALRRFALAVSTPAPLAGFPE